MSPWSMSMATGLSRFPRVSGDEPKIEIPVNDNTGFSPRERG